MRCTRGFTLIEVLVAMVVLTIALLGIGRVAAEGVRQGAAATRLARTLEVIERVAATGSADGSARGCDVKVRHDAVAIAWRWIEVRCRHVERSVEGEVPAGSSAGDREVVRVLLVPS